MAQHDLRGSSVTAYDASLSIGCQAAEVERAARWLDAFAACAELPAEVTGRFQIVLDEILTNVMRHGAHETRTAGPIDLHMSREAGAVELTVMDRGPAFDMTDAVPVPASVRVAARQPGGVGLLFVRNLMDDVRYERLGDVNRTVFSKRLAPLAREGCTDGDL